MIQQSSDPKEEITNFFKNLQEEIDEGILENDNEIQQSIEEKLNNFEGDLRIEFLNQMHDKLKGRTFLNLSQFQVNNNIVNNKPGEQIDLKKLYNEALLQKNYNKIFQAIKDPQFCEINGIPLEIKEYIDSLKNLGENVQLIFDLFQVQKNIISYSFIQNLELLLRLFYLNDKRIHQFVGSCLLTQIYEFENYIDTFKETYNQEFQLVIEKLGKVQLKEETSQQSRQSFSQSKNNKNIFQLFDLLTIDIQTYNHITIIEFLEHLTNFNIQGNDENQIIQYFLFTENFNWQVDFLYFKLVIYFWVRYTEKFQLRETLKNFYEKKLLRSKNKLPTMEREFKEIKKSLQDLIFQNLIHKFVYFNQLEDKKFIENYNQYQVKLKIQKLKYENFKFQTLENFINESDVQTQQNYINFLKFYQLKNLKQLTKIELTFIQFVSTTPFTISTQQILKECFKINGNLLDVKNKLKKVFLEKISTPSDKDQCLFLNILNYLYSQTYIKQEVTNKPLKIKSWLEQIELFNKQPLNLNIILEEFNISLTQENIQITQQKILEWLNDMKKDQKRGEPWQDFLDLITQNRNEIIKNGIDCFNIKSLFQILFNNSNKELKVILIKQHSKNYPIPFIYKNSQLDNPLQNLDLYKFNQDIYYLLQQDFTIINCSLSRIQQRIGKTQLLNKIFYKDDKFEICDSSLINKNTIDCNFDFSFNGSRNYLIADTHGQFEDDVLQLILPFFKLWIIQMKSEKELVENIYRVNKLLKQINIKPFICFIIRDSQTEKIIQDEIQKIDAQQVKVCLLSNLQQMDKQKQEGEINKIRNILLEIIGKENENIEESQLKLQFLQVCQNFGMKVEEIHQVQKIVDELEIELNKIQSEKEGFYSGKAFPLRSTEWNLQQLQQQKIKIDLQIKQNQQMLDQKERSIYEFKKQNSQDDLKLQTNFNDKKKEKEDILNKLNSLNQEKEKINQLTFEFEQKMKNINFNQSNLLQIFSSIFKLDNFYIGYLQIVESIAKFNQINISSIEDQIKKLKEQEKHDQQQREDQEKHNQQQQEIQEKEIQILQDNLKFKNISIELFWREIIQGNFYQILNYTQTIVKLIQKGEPFEFLNGDDLSINFNFLRQLGSLLIKEQENKILVISILGPQSSGKSTLLNKIFGCHFLTSVGRCTKGMYLQLLKISNKEQFQNLFDYILLLDSEGLQNPNQQDSEFDKRLALFIISISDIIILNVKGEINLEFHNLIEMCLFTLGKHQKLQTSKQIIWCFNQNSQTNDKKKLYKQIEDIVENLKRESKQEIDFSKISGCQEDEIELLGMASVSEKWNNVNCLTKSKEWNQEKKIEGYSKDAYSVGIKSILRFIQKHQKLLDERKLFLSWDHFTKKVEECWQIVSRLPDVVEFAELKDQRDYEKLNKILHSKLKQKNIQISHQVSQLTYKIQMSINKDGIQNLDFLKSVKNTIEGAFKDESKQIEEEILQELIIETQSIGISKKILRKMQDHLSEIITSHTLEGSLLIQQEIYKYERRLQEKLLHLKIEEAVQQILSDKEKLILFQQNQQKRNSEFEQIWMNIIEGSNNQIELIFNEFQQQLFDSIYLFQKNYIYKFDNYLDYIGFYKEKFNKAHPEKEQLLEQLSWQIFQEEFQKQSFFALQRENGREYSYIFSQKINQMIELMPENCIINPFIYIAENNNQKDSIQDFKNQLQLIQNQNEMREIIFNFLRLVNSLQIDLDLQQEQRIRNTLQEGENFPQNKLIVFEYLIQIFNTLKINQQTFKRQDLQKKDINFLLCYFPKINLSFELVQNKGSEELKNYIIIQEERVYTNKLPRNSSLYNYFEYIISQNTKLMDEQTFAREFPSEFNKIMDENNGWDKLCQSIYNLIKQELFSQSSIMKSNIVSQMWKEEDTTQINSSLILRIMNKIENELKFFNSQFAFYGITISRLFERKLYCYSIFAIWRFICYQKWEIYDQEKQLLKSQKQQLKILYEDEILQRKQEMSIQKAKFVAKQIQIGLIGKFYCQNISKVQQYIEQKLLTSFEVIQYLDQQLLIKKKKIETVQKDFSKQIELYVFYQKKFIELYVESYIQDIKAEIFKNYQINVKIQDYLEQILTKLMKLYQQISNNYKIKELKLKDLFKDQELDQANMEKRIFIEVLNFIFGNQIENLDQFCKPQIFENNYDDCLIPKIQDQIVNSTSQKSVYKLSTFLECLQAELQLLRDQRIELSLERFSIQNILDSIQIHMRGCNQTCPMCNRKCDSDNFKSKDHQHKCQNGHQLRGMNRIIINSYPSLFTCEEIIDEAELKIVETNRLKPWREIKQYFQNWSFKDLLSQQKIEENKQKMMNIWNGGIGELICKQLSKEMRQEIVCLKKYDIPMSLQTHSTHYIFIIDDSISMKQYWQAVIKCVQEQFKYLSNKKNVKVSVIIFGTSARIVINCKEVDIDKQIPLIQFQGQWFTHFGPALKLAQELVIQNQEFSQTMILFYTDGQPSWYSTADEHTKNFCMIEKRFRDQIYFSACSQPNVSYQLQNIVDRFSQSFASAQLRERIEPFQLNDVWTEIISQNHHKYLA
ncbi:unnamed protein product [Paramecium sonneborni]|uniref:VLIG-type G domain-containing protein n=1 Tax=Paramecium sonneborni TaxID=65129 RepID=A0A8S1P595_9CILI|nr:unnamed protein product [Paramecium sonneborni]